MLSDYLKGNINFVEQVSSWEDSITVAAEPLLKKGFITDKYVENMIANVHEHGPYIVIVPGFAMPHAENKEGEVIKTGVSLLKLENGVLYPENKEVKIVMVLAAEDSSGHLELISDLSSVLIEDDLREQLENATDEETIMQLIDSAED